MPRTSKNLSVVLCGAAVLLFSGYCLFYKLGTEPLQDYDEATYAEVTHEGIEHHDQSALFFLNQPYFRKPPLLFWMTTASSHVIHDVEFADRFPSALAGFAAVVLVALICIEAGTGVWTGVVAGGIIATTATWLEFARNVRFDNLVALFIAAAFYAGIRALRDSRWFLIVGIALALAALAKSVISVFGDLSVLALLVQSRKLGSALRDRYFWFGAGVSLLVLIPWHLYMTLTYGMAFWHSYLGTEVIERASSNLFPGGNNPTNGQYLQYILNFAAPWSELFVITLAGTPFLLRRMTGIVRNVFSTSVIVVIAVLIVMFSAHTKAFGYLMPMYPFLAVALALAGWTIWHQAGKHRYATTLQPLLIGITIVLFAYGAALSRYEALHLDPYYGSVIGQAYEEHDVSHLISAAPNPEVYTYGGYSDLGSIYFYTHLPDTQNPYILLWSASSTPSATSTAFILATSSLSSLSASFPQYRFTQDYSGKFVSLFTVAGSRAAAAR